MCGSGLVYGNESQHQLWRRVLHCVLHSVLISLWHAHWILHIRACPERHARMGGGQSGPTPQLLLPGGASTTPSTLLLDPIHSMLSAGVNGSSPPRWEHNTRQWVLFFSP